MNTDMQPAGSMRLFRVFAGIGAAAIAAGVFLAPVRMSSNLLLVSYFLLGIGLAAVFFVALEYATGAGWSVAFRRVPEAASSALPVGAAGLILSLSWVPGSIPGRMSSLADSKLCGWTCHSSSRERPFTWRSGWV